MDKENIQLLALTLFGICGFFLFVLLLVFYDLDQHDGDDGHSSTGRPWKNHYNQQSKDKLSENAEFDHIHDQGILDVYNYDYDDDHPDLTCAVHLNDVPHGHLASVNGHELPADISTSSFNGVARRLKNELDSCRFIRQVSVDQLMELNLLHEGRWARSYMAILDGREHVVVKRFSTDSSNATAAKVDCDLYNREKSIYETIVSASHNTNQHDAFTECMVGIKAATYCSPHLVALLGYCEDGDERLLVFEHVAGHGSLAQVIASSRCLSSNLIKQKVNSVHPTTEEGWPINVLPLPWITRLKVAIGVAQGLAFLHHKGISHRDVKASSILLTEDYTPKLRSLSKAQTIKDQGKPLCDIYCFGKVLLDLISGLDISGGNADDARQAWMLRALALMSVDHSNHKNRYTRALPLMPPVEIILGSSHGRYGNRVDDDIIIAVAKSENDDVIHGPGDDKDNDNGCNHDCRRCNHNHDLNVSIHGYDYSNHNHGHDNSAVQKNQANRDRLLLELMKDPSLILEADMAEEAMGVALIANACLNIRVLHKLSMDILLQLLKNPASAHHHLRQLQYSHN